MALTTQHRSAAVMASLQVSSQFNSGVAKWYNLKADRLSLYLLVYLSTALLVLCSTCTGYCARSAKSLDSSNVYLSHDCTMSVYTYNTQCLFYTERRHTHTVLLLQGEYWILLYCPLKEMNIMWYKPTLSFSCYLLTKRYLCFTL